MPVQHSPPSKNTRSQRHKAVLTPTERAPLDHTQSVHQLSANLDRVPPMEGAEPSRRGGPRSILGEAEDEKGLESEETEMEDALTGFPEASEAANLAHFNKPLFSQDEPNFLKMMDQITQFMGKLTQAVAPRDNSKAPAFKTPDPFYSTQAHKLRGFIQSCQLIFHNDQDIFSLTGRKFFIQLLFSLVEPAKNPNPTSQIFPKKILPISSIIGTCLKPNYLLCLAIPLKIGDWGERAYIHIYRRGLESRSLDQLDSHPGTFETLQELMDITLELDTRYHERQKEKGGNQEKKPPVTGSNFSKPPQDSCSKRPHHKKNKKDKKSQFSKDEPHASLLNKNSKLIGSENKRRIKEVLCTYCSGKNPIEKCFKRRQNKLGSSRGFPSKQGKS
ncbi:hypothetical protein O181_023945 [Austropuccinia psidii MF-1]|uniref:Uncharacterized protein n=1 Tax=Austropuccinia psidii MF-1 TaxID=1389203 RepID=A0A9Q3CK23_9BASI|nr:hypothetical protein [Austropuccinia psidii MF-1]